MWLQIHAIKGRISLNYLKRKHCCSCWYIARLFSCTIKYNRERAKLTWSHSKKHSKSLTHNCLVSPHDIFYMITNSPTHTSSIRSKTSRSYYINIEINVKYLTLLFFSLSISSSVRKAENKISILASTVLGNNFLQYMLRSVALF